MRLAELFAPEPLPVLAERLRVELQQRSTPWVERLDVVLARYLAVVRDELWRRAKAEDPEAEIPTRPDNTRPS